MKVSASFGLLLVLFSMVLAASQDEDDKVFNEWRAKYKKSYCSKEAEDKARQNVLEHHREIEEHNKRYDEGKESYHKRLASHSDLTDEEMLMYRHGYEPGDEDELDMKRSRLEKQRKFPKGPKSVDWRRRSLVSPVPDQGQCGSCWAFSTAAVVDVVHRKKNRKGFSSVQQLVDCFTRDDGKLCAGSKPNWALEYVKDHGMTDQDSYPYVAQQGTCKYNETMKKYTIKNYYRIDLHGNETEMANIVAAVGPIAMAMYASPNFHGYGGGVFKDDLCGDLHPNHTPVLVGYGTDPKHGEYWLIRNSWGTDWGENGYMRLARNYPEKNSNLCRAAHFAIYAE